MEISNRPIPFVHSYMVRGFVSFVNWKQPGLIRFDSIRFERPSGCVGSLWIHQRQLPAQKRLWTPTKTGRPGLPNSEESWHDSFMDRKSRKRAGMPFWSDDRHGSWRAKCEWVIGRKRRKFQISSRSNREMNENFEQSIERKSMQERISRCYCYRTFSTYRKTRQHAMISLERCQFCWFK